jgi:hypothetical protein
MAGKERILQNMLRIIHWDIHLLYNTFSKELISALPVSCLFGFWTILLHAMSGHDTVPSIRGSFQTQPLI